MKTPLALSLSASLLLASCGNPAISGDCKRTGSGAGKRLALADAMGAPDLQSAPGGLLVYDEIATDSFSKGGDLAASLAKDRKCSAALLPRKKNGKAYFEVTSAENCLRPFVWAGLNQRIFLYRPESKTYQEFKITDSRVLAMPKLFDLFSKLPVVPRTRAVKNAFIEKATGTYEYAQDVKKMNDAEATAYFARQCWTVGKATPDPENCLWVSGTRSDFIEVEPSDAASFDAFVAQYESFSRKNIEKINLVSSGLGSKISAFTEGNAQFSAVYDDYLARMVATFWIDCKSAVPTDHCYGLTLEQRKVLSTTVIGLYQPKRISEFEAAFASKDLAAAKKAMLAKITADLVQGVSLTLAPGLDAYEAFRDKFSRRKDLVSVLSNHLEGTKLEPEKISFKALSPFALPLPEPLKGIVFSFRTGNIFLSHPGASVNQNLAMDGHIGSVLAFGGVPLVAFSPANIDQSDATSVMPIPKTATKATAADTRAPAETSTSKKTVGEGKNTDGC